MICSLEPRRSSPKSERTPELIYEFTDGGEGGLFDQVYGFAVGGFHLRFL